MARVRLAKKAANTNPAINWNDQFHRHTLPIVAAVAAAGFVFGALSGGGDEAEGPGSRRVLNAGTSAMGNAVDTMVDALIAAASVRAADYIDEWLPGYRDQFTRRLG